MKASILLVVLLSAVAVRADFEQSPNSTVLEEIPSNDFVFNPPTPSNTIPGVGYSQRRTSREWPTLVNMGLAQTSFTLEACGVRTPHIHQKAAGLLYVIQAANLTVGFVQENGTLVESVISTGMSAVFPQGLVHYQYNSGCTEATYTITYNDDEGATVNIIPALFKLPSDLVASSLGVDVATVESIKAPTGNFLAGPPSCVATCAALTTSSFAGRKLM